MKWWLLAAVVVTTGCANARAARDLALIEESLHACRCLGVGLTTGRDAPGSPERLFLADEKGVRALALDGSTADVWSAPRFERLVRLDAGDFDGDGVTELVVVVQGGRMRSAVLVPGEDGRVRSGGWYHGYLRPIRAADGAWQLVGQRPGGDRPFRGTPEFVTWSADGFEVGEAAGAPPRATLFDWFWLPGEERDRLFVLEETGHLTERDSRSPRSQVWRSDDRPVARPVEIERSYRELLGSEEEEVLRLASPVVIGDRDGVRGALLVGGNGTPVPVLRNLRVLQGGELRWLQTEHRGLTEVVRTPVLGTAMVAGAVWSPDDEHTVWAGLAWTRDPAGFAPPESRVFLFEPERGDVVAPATVAGWAGEAP